MVSKKKVEKKKVEAPGRQSLTVVGDVVAVKWDASALDSFNYIAIGLTENAKALGKMADVLRATGHRIDALIKVDHLGTAMVDGDVIHNGGGVRMSNGTD